MSIEAVTHVMLCPPDIAIVQVPETATDAAMDEIRAEFAKFAMRAIVIRARLVGSISAERTT